MVLGAAPQRGFHVAVASPRGTSVFLGFGCDEVEGACFNDAYMLDMNNGDGARWLRLPIGLQRPTPRHMAVAWVHGTSMAVSGGCAPAVVSPTRSEKCFSDVWGARPAPADEMFDRRVRAKLPRIIYWTMSQHQSLEDSQSKAP